MSTLPTLQADIAWAHAARAQQFATWLARVTREHRLQPDTLRMASSDASFRRYFRIDSAHASRIIMDAPADQASSQPFVHVAGLMRAAGLRVPDVLDWDSDHGFLLLSDLGEKTLLQAINPAAPPPLAYYLQAVDALLRWQMASKPDVLPTFDAAFLRREVELFPQWYVTAHRGQEVDARMRKTLDDNFTMLIAENLRAPNVYMHRDFMPRNLMVGGTPQEALGVLDFQDAVYGPITYDIASLLRDAFISWEEDFCLDVTVRYWERARKLGLPVGEDFGAFYRAVEWMGLQRHLKIAGLFARLSLRDAKPHYVADTPRFMAYIHATCSRYRELAPLLRLIERVEDIRPAQGLAFGRI